MSYDFDQQQPGISGGAKVAIGCAAAAFVVVALVCGGIVWVGYLAVDKAEQVVQQVITEMEKQVEAFATKFEVQGYTRVKGQAINVTTDIDKPTVYTVQVFTLNADSNADLAVMAQAAEINGNIDGDLHFYGQSLTISPDAVITGDLHIEFAQVVNNRGKVEGSVFEDGDMDGDEPPVPETVDGKPLPGDVVPRQDTEEQGEPDSPESEASSKPEEPPAKERPSDDPPDQPAQETVPTTEADSIP